MAAVELSPDEGVAAEVAVTATGTFSTDGEFSFNTRPSPRWTSERWEAALGTLGS